VITNLENIFYSGFTLNYCIIWSCEILFVGSSFHWCSEHLNSSRRTWSGFVQISSITAVNKTRSMHQ